MEVVNHPYLEGVKCREDGAIWGPQSGTHKAHWTFGYVNTGGYRVVFVRGKHYLVHRLICEAFHGICPPDKCQADHIDRDKSNNRPENIRWVTCSGNNRNKKVCEESLAKYGVSSVDDDAAYRRAYYANNLEFREKRRAYGRTRYAKKKASNQLKKPIMAH